MAFSHWIAVAAVAFLPLAATAQQSQPPNPTDANATVPAVSFLSAFDNCRATPGEKTTPDQVWRTANEKITRQDMHGGHVMMPGMGPASYGKPMSMLGMEATKPGPKSDPALFDLHAGHHNMQGK